MPTSCRSDGLRRPVRPGAGWGRRRRRGAWDRRRGGATRRWPRSWRRCRCTATAGAGTPTGRSRPAASATLARRREFAATPPPSASTGASASSAAASSFTTNWSTTASWNDAATSAQRRRRARRRVWLTTAVLSPANEKAVSPGIGAREAHRGGIAFAGQPVDRRAARIPEAEVARHLVERLARGVVDGLADHPVAPVVLHDHRHGVATRHDEHRERRHEVGVFEPRRVQVRLEVVHAHVGQVGREREPLGRGHAHEQRAGEAGPVARGHRVEVAQLDARLDQRFRDHRRDELHVGAAGDLGHHAAEARVQVDLARHHRRAHGPTVLDHRGRGLVARRLDAEDQRHQRRPSSNTVSPGSMRSIESSSAAYSGWSTSCTHITSASSLTSW